MAVESRDLAALASAAPLERALGLGFCASPIRHTHRSRHRVWLAEVEKLEDGAEDGSAAPPAVIYRRVRCPHCNSTDTKVKKTLGRIRHHKCGKCAARFKSVEVG